MIYRLIKTVVQLMSYIPLPVGQFAGEMLGAAIGLIPMDRATVSLDNIQKSFSMGIDDARRLNRKVLVHFGQMLFEIPHILRLSQGNIHRYVVFVNEENLLNALKRGKGGFILTGHFGNWELMAAAIAIRFGSGAVVTRPIDFQPLDQFIDELRSRYGTEVIPKQRSMRKVMSTIKQNRIVGILLDQNVDWYEGVFVKFLGRWACTNKGLALMALKTGTPVIPAFSVRQGDGRYQIIFEKEVELIRSGNKTGDVEDNTALFTAIIEKYIRNYPDHWFWFHRRWKTRPYCTLPESFYLLTEPTGAQRW